MNKRPRTRRVEMKLTPQQAVLFWLREVQRAGSLTEYQRSLANLPLSQFPRSRINRQITVAVREALKDSSADLICRTTRSAAMQADFLILLILEVNQAVLHDAECRRLRLELLMERMQHRAQNWTDDECDNWIGLLLFSVVAVLGLKSVIQQIESEHFSNTPVLFSDASQTLERELALIHKIYDTYNVVVAGCPDEPFDLQPLMNILEPSFRPLAGVIRAKAKSGTLNAFSRPEAAAALMRPYWNRNAIHELTGILQ
jgi:hypothetical protein